MWLLSGLLILKSMLTIEVSGNVTISITTWSREFLIILGMWFLEGFCCKCKMELYEDLILISSFIGDFKKEWWMMDEMSRKLRNFEFRFGDATRLTFPKPTRFKSSAKPWESINVQLQPVHHKILHLTEGPMKTDVERHEVEAYVIQRHKKISWSTGSSLHKNYSASHRTLVKRLRQHCQLFETSNQVYLGLHYSFHSELLSIAIFCDWTQ